MATPTTLYLRSFALGFVCGMRSMLGPALVRPRLASGARKGTRPRAIAESPITAILLPMFAAAELVGDKLPIARDRTELPSVIVRSVSGAGVAAALALSEERPALPSAVCGLVGALIATYGIFYLRRTVGQKTHLPNIALGLIEDGAALALGVAAVRSEL